METKGTAMKKPLIVMLALTAAVGCSRLNPVNWFGKSSPTPVVVVTDAPAPQDPRPLIQQVASLRIEETPDGAIVRAVGVAPTQGYWQAALLPRRVTDGVLVYDFRAVPPITAMPVSTQASREVTVAAGVDRATLAGVRQIVVQGASNALTSGR